MQSCDCLTVPMDIGSFKIKGYIVGLLGKERRGRRREMGEGRKKGEPLPSPASSLPYFLPSLFMTAYVPN